jgi:hypothetical protein
MAEQTTAARVQIACISSICDGFMMTISHALHNLDICIRWVSLWSVCPSQGSGQQAASGKQS